MDTETGEIDRLRATEPTSGGPAPMLPHRLFSQPLTLLNEVRGVTSMVGSTPRLRSFSPGKTARLKRFSTKQLKRYTLYIFGMRNTDRQNEEMNRPANQTRGYEHRRLRPKVGESIGRPQPHFPDQGPTLPLPPPDHHSAMDIDLLNQEDEFVLTAAVPGFRPDEIDVTLDDDVVRIEATHDKADEQEEEGRYIARELRQSMSRSVALGTPIAEDKEISGSYEKGVVTIRLPKAEPAEDSSGRQIDIE